MSDQRPSGATTSGGGTLRSPPVESSRLYIVTGEQRKDDHLDIIAGARSALIAHYRDVRWVTPEGDISLRTLRRGQRPGRDRVLFDFTRPSTARWAAETARASAGGILCGARRLPLQTTASTSLRRARRRYGGLLRDFFAHRRLAALDVDIPAAGYRLERPAFKIAPLTSPDGARCACAVICASDGVEEAYGALRGWQAARANGVVPESARLLISVASAEDLAEVCGYLRFFGGSAADLSVTIERRTHRADLAMIAARSDILVDLDRFSWTGKTEALAAAEAAGIPHLRITSYLSDIATEFEDALAAPPLLSPVASPSASQFAESLIQFIETAQHAAVSQRQRAGAAA